MEIPFSLADYLEKKKMSEKGTNAGCHESATKTKCNQDLTPQQKAAKRALKRELKAQRKRAKLETRLKHSIVRKDSRLQNETREALRNLGQVEPLEVVDERIELCRRFLVQFCRELTRRQNAKMSNKLKETQTEKAVTLLRHMTKGTQDIRMFDIPDALWGYTRQKFKERAMLVARSLAKLDPNRQSPTAGNIPQTTLQISRNCWEKVTCLRRICSVGCGPGCDAVGVGAFLQEFNKGNSRVDHAILLDWAIDKWQMILDPVVELASSTHIASFSLGHCDISRDLHDKANKDALSKISPKEACCEVDLFLFSYILTETRGSWEPFLKSLVECAKKGTLFYFAEPTPWQLHQVRKLFEGTLEFVWLDSSMDTPAMQPLDRRLGPGVLMGRKC